MEDWSCHLCGACHLWSKGAERLGWVGQIPLCSSIGQVSLGLTSPVEYIGTTMWNRFCIEDLRFKAKISCNKVAAFQIESHGSSML